MSRGLLSTNQILSLYEPLLVQKSTVLHSELSLCSLVVAVFLTVVCRSQKYSTASRAQPVQSVRSLVWTILFKSNDVRLFVCSHLIFVLEGGFSVYAARGGAVQVTNMIPFGAMMDLCCWDVKVKLVMWLDAQMICIAGQCMYGV